MKILKFCGGFTQSYDNAVVREITFRYDDVSEVTYQDATTKIFVFPKKINGLVYNAQYGIPLSANGEVLFVGRWENPGVVAYHIPSEKVLWEFRTNHIRNIAVFDSALIAVQANKAIFKIDADTGEQLAQIRANAANFSFLTYPYALVNRIGGKIWLIDIKRIQQIKGYSDKEYNPNHCLSWYFTAADIEDGKLMLEGYECGKNQDTQDTNNVKYRRTLDLDIMNVLYHWEASAEV